MDIIFQAIFGEVGSEKYNERFSRKILKKKNRKNIIRQKSNIKKRTKKTIN